MQPPPPRATSPLAAPAGQTAKLAVVHVGATVPDCALLDLCTETGLSPTQCVDDPSFLRIETYEGQLVDVALDAEAIAADAAVLPAGEFFTVLADPSGGCALTVATFTEERLVVADAADAVGVVAGGAP